MENNNYLINVIALSESFLENKKRDLDGINDFIIRKNNKNGEKIDIKVNKETYLQTMVDIFSSNVSDLSSVEIYFIKNNETIYLNGISIF